MTNSLTSKQTKEMKKVVKKLGGFYGTSKSRELQMCTHFVVGTFDTTINHEHENGRRSLQRMAKSRNVNQQSAMLMGKWLVSYQ